jgi:hypothetical protein
MIRLPRGRLPSDPHARHGALRDYFCDKDAEALEGTDDWELRLFWPSDRERHVDPALDVGLAWWNEGVERETMAFARRREGPIMRALYDTWTLHSWSQWLARRAMRAGDAPIILHVDDHRDLAPPRLYRDATGFRDAISGERLDLSQPDAVERAILSGALGMGSFLTPFLHAFPQSQVRHLCQPPKVRQTADFRIVLETRPDDLLDAGAPRPAVKLASDPGSRGPGTYRATCHVESWLEGLGDAPILLHIDMDYFNNRYDGDTDWTSRSEILDPPLSDVLDKVDEMLEALRRSDLATRIEDVVIAFSPGFFPAEFWEPADARIAAGLAALDEG